MCVCVRVCSSQNTVAAVLPGFAFWCLMLTSASAADRLRTYGILSPANTRGVCQFIGEARTHFARRLDAADLHGV